MIRASLSAHNRLLREQQQRRKRETNHEVADQDERTRHIAAQAMLEALPSTPARSEVPKQETKSHTQKTETPKRQPVPEPQTLARINAHIDAALQTAAPTGPLFGLPRPNKGIEHAPWQRTA